MPGKKTPKTPKKEPLSSPSSDAASETIEEAEVIDISTGEVIYETRPRRRRSSPRWCSRLLVLHTGSSLPSPSMSP